MLATKVLEKGQVFSNGPLPRCTADFDTDLDTHSETSTPTSTPDTPFSQRLPLGESLGRPLLQPSMSSADQRTKFSGGHVAFFVDQMRIDVGVGLSLGTVSKFLSRSHSRIDAMVSYSRAIDE